MAKLAFAFLHSRARDTPVMSTHVVARTGLGRSRASYLRPFRRWWHNTASFGPALGCTTTERPVATVEDSNTLKPWCLQILTIYFVY